MARPNLTLAALSTAAVAGLDVVTSTSTGSPGGDFESALLTSREGAHFMIRVPRNERADAEQSADLVALRALSTGVRARLPFELTSYVGQTPAGKTRAVVYNYLYGTPLSLEEIPAEGPLAGSIGRAIAAIHTLPTSFITDAGLQTFTPAELLRSVATVMDRAAATNLIPAALLGRWERAIDDAALWQFAPTVVNGALSASSFLTVEDNISAILGWHELSVGDPARDLYWLLGTPDSTAADLAFDAYNFARGSSDRQIKQRAMLYAELEIAKWLLHGTQERSTEIVDDAVAMLHGLVDTVENNLDQTLSHNTLPVMALDEVEAMLDKERRSVVD
jgi:macrolide phosphotransferase